MGIARRPCLLVFGSLLFSSALAAQVVVTGTVRDDSTGRPVAGAEVLIEALGQRVTTNSQGRYTLTGLPTGMRLVLVRAVGYHPLTAMVQLAAGDTAHLDVTLEARVVELAPIEVREAPPRGPRGLGPETFEERRRMGFGRFIDSVTLRRNEHVRLADLLRRQNGIGIARNPANGDLVAVSLRHTDVFGRSCVMQVWLDGAILYRPNSPGSGFGGTGPPPDLRMFDTSTLEAVEIYRSAAETPMEFGGQTAGCGTVVLWTRRGP
jgi:hypothetical protein